MPGRAVAGTGSGRRALRCGLRLAMTRLAILTTVLSLILFGSASFGAPMQSRSAKDLLVEIAREKDGVDPKVFDQLKATDATFEMVTSNTIQ